MSIIDSQKSTLTVPQTQSSRANPAAHLLAAFYLGIRDDFVHRALAAAAIRARAAGLNLLRIFRFPVDFRWGARVEAGTRVGAAAERSTAGKETADAGASSIPKMSATSVSLMTGAPSVVAAVWRTASAAEALLIRSAGSTPRSRKSRAGFWSSLAPTP